MGIDDYFTEYSRRDFLKTIGVGALAVCGLSSYARASEKRRTLSEDDKNLLIDNTNWGGAEFLRKEYNDLAVKYMEVLDEKGKYNPEKKDALKKSIADLVANTETRKEKVDIIKKQLLLESNPEKYLKTYIPFQKSAEKIRNLKISKEIRKYFEEKYGIKFSSGNSDLSDKIRVYNYYKQITADYERKVSEDITNEILNPLIRVLEGLLK